jgi:hypothetical protein
LLNSLDFSGAMSVVKGISLSLVQKLFYPRKKINFYSFYKSMNGCETQWEKAAGTIGSAENEMMDVWVR